MSTLPLRRGSQQESVLRNQRAPKFPTVYEPNPWVSEYSHWFDVVWKFEPVTAGVEGHVTMGWGLPLVGGGNLMNKEHASLLHELRCLALSCFIDPRTRVAYKTTSAGAISAGLRNVARWMIAHQYDSLSQLDAAAFSEYLEDILSHFNSEDSEDEELEVGTLQADEENWCASKVEVEEDVHLTKAYLYRRLHAWKLLWDQRMALEDLGISVSREPFHTKPVSRICNELATVALRRIPPVPDAVAIEVLNGAHLFIERVAEDLIKFSRVAAPVYAIATTTSRPNVIVQRMLRDQGAMKSIPYLNFNEEVSIEALQESRVLMQISEALSDFTGAGATILQAETGMRINELLAVPSGWNVETKLPSCIEVKTSISGAMDLYYFRAMLSKTRKAPVESRWLLGARLKGSPNLPASVRVVVLLHQVFDPWRHDQDNEKDQRLLVLFGGQAGGRTGFPKGGGGVLRRFWTSSSLLQRCRGFTKRHVNLGHLPDLPELRQYKETCGACIRSHQWRKSYARFVYHVDGKLLPAIARQFKHVSLAMTEGAYVGTVSDAVAEYNRSKAVDLLLDYGRGKPIAREGRLAKTLEKYKAEIAELLAGKDEHEEYAAIYQWACDRDLRMFFHGYGGCIPSLAPTEAECHKKAGTTHWSNKGPNYCHRSASVCTGCFLFIAGPETVDYWTQRFIDNMTAWAQAKRIGREREFRVQFERTQQSEKYLRTLGAPIPIIPITPAEATDGR